MSTKLFIAVVICMICALICLCITYFSLFNSYNSEEKNYGIISAILFSVFTALILLIV